MTYINENTAHEEFPTNFSQIEQQHTTSQLLKERSEEIKSEYPATSLPRRQVIPSNVLEDNQAFYDSIKRLANYPNKEFFTQLPEKTQKNIQSLRKKLLQKKGASITLLEFYWGHHSNIIHGKFSHQAFAKALEEEENYQKNSGLYILECHLLTIETLYDKGFTSDFTLKNLKMALRGAEKTCHTIEEHLENVESILNRLNANIITFSRIND